jgi:mono/diheme cytochrome c family protein
MKKALILSVLVIFSFCTVGSAFAAKKAPCPQKRKTVKKASSSIAKKDKTASADKANGKLIYTKTAKPQACVMCHGKKGNGMGKLGAIMNPKPRNFTCKKTMKDISAGQMFYVIKNGGKVAKGMPNFKWKNDKEIWDVVKYIRTDLMK